MANPPVQAAPIAPPAAAPKIRVKAADGTIYNFPNTATPEQMRTAVMSDQAKRKGDIYKMAPGDLTLHEKQQRKYAENAGPDGLGRTIAEGINEADDFAHALGNAMTLHVGDYAGPAVAAGVKKLQGGDFSDEYSKGRAELQREAQNYEKRSPVLSTTAEIAGSLATPIPELGLISKGARLLHGGAEAVGLTRAGSAAARAARPVSGAMRVADNVADAAAIGGVTGATTSGANHGESAAEGAGLGALLSAATHGIIRAPGALARGSRRLFNEHAGDVSRNVADASRLGVTPNLLATSTGKFPNTLAKVNAGAPIVGNRLRQASATTIRETGDAMERTARALAPDAAGAHPRAGIGAESREQIGASTRRGVEEGLGDKPTYGTMDIARARRVASQPTGSSSYREKEDAMHTIINDGTRGQRIIPAETIHALRDVLNDTSSAALNETRAGPLRTLHDALTTRDESGRMTERLDYNSLQRERRRIGEGLRGVGDFAKLSESDLKHVYASMTRDLERIVRRSDPTGRLFQAFNRANRYSERGREVFKGLADLTGAGSNEQVAQRLLVAGRSKGGNIAVLRSAKRRMPPEQWHDIRAGVLREMGRPGPGSAAATAGQDFSPSLFATEFNKLSPAARSLFFEAPGNVIRENIEALHRFSGQLKSIEGLENRSNSANLGIAAGWGSGLGAHTINTLKLLGGADVFNRLMTSPRFAGVIAGIGRARTPLQMEQAAARLAALAKLTGVASGHAAGALNPAEEGPRRVSAPTGPSNRQSAPAP